MKTIREWLETLEEPYRSQAIENAICADQKDGINVMDTQKTRSLLGAIKTAFIWSNSPEGHEYWADLVSNLNEKQS